MKTVAQELTEALATIEAGKADVARLTGELAKSVETIAAMQVTIDTAAADKVTMETAHAAAIKDITGKLETEAAAHVVTTKALAEANKKLADPAYRMASAEGDKAGALEGAPANGELALTQAQAMAEYRKLDGKPDEQKAYRAKNWRVLGCDEEKA